MKNFRRMMLLLKKIIRVKNKAVAGSERYGFVLCCLIFSRCTQGNRVPSQAMFVSCFFCENYELLDDFFVLVSMDFPDYSCAAGKPYYWDYADLPNDPAVLWCVFSRKRFPCHFSFPNLKSLRPFVRCVDNSYRGLCFTRNKTKPNGE